MKARDIINILEKKFPKINAEEWDNVGLLIGDYDKEVKKIQFSLDASRGVRSSAVVLAAGPSETLPLSKVSSNTSSTQRRNSLATLVRANMPSKWQPRRLNTRTCCLPPAVGSSITWVILSVNSSALRSNTC